MRNKDFRDELASLLNKYSRENRSNTPDFILALYLVRSLLAFDLTCKEREKWYGHYHAPGGVVTELEDPFDPTVGAGNIRKCEGCGKPATGEDVEGVPLCDACGKPETQPIKSCKICGDTDCHMAGQDAPPCTQFKAKSAPAQWKPKVGEICEWFDPEGKVLPIKAELCKWIEYRGEWLCWLQYCTPHHQLIEPKFLRPLSANPPVHIGDSVEATLTNPNSTYTPRVVGVVVSVADSVCEIGLNENDKVRQRCPFADYRFTKLVPKES